MFEDENPNSPDGPETSAWEVELQQRVSELLAARLNPLTTELERLQTAVTEAHSRLQAQAQTSATADETAALTTQIKTLLDTSASQAEQQFHKSMPEPIRLKAGIDVQPGMVKIFQVAAVVEVQQYLGVVEVAGTVAGDEVVHGPQGNQIGSQQQVEKSTFQRGEGQSR